MKGLAMEDPEKYNKNTFLPAKMRGKKIGFFLL